MKPAPFTYHDPTTIDELNGLIGSLEDVKLLAGGQSLVPMLNMRYAQPDHLIDLNTVAGLSGINVNGDSLTIGAMTRQAALMDSEILQQKLPIICEALNWVGHFQTRSRGTIGGSLCHLDPSAELPAISLLYDAQLTLSSPDGIRKVPMEEWPVAYMMPSLSENEFLKEITFSPWQVDHTFAFEEFSRRHGDFAIVAAGCLLAINNGSIERAAIVIAGANQVPYRLSEAEQVMIGQPATDQTFKAAAEIAVQQDAMSDAYVSLEYRQRLAGVMTERALTKAAKQATERV